MEESGEDPLEPSSTIHDAKVTLQVLDKQFRWREDQIYIPLRMLGWDLGRGREGLSFVFPLEGRELMQARGKEWTQQGLWMSPT